MPETPDFERIAQRLQTAIDDQQYLTKDSVWLIVEQLRLVWNARGAADATLFLTDPDHRDILERITTLDR